MLPFRTAPAAAAAASPFLRRRRRTAHSSGNSSRRLCASLVAAYVLVCVQNTRFFQMMMIGMAGRRGSLPSCFLSPRTCTGARFRALIGPFCVSLPLSLTHSPPLSRGFSVCSVLWGRNHPPTNRASVRRWQPPPWRRPRGACRHRPRLHRRRRPAAAETTTGSSRTRQCPASRTGWTTSDWEVPIWSSPKCAVRNKQQ
jgi:hypothetical protein